MRFFRWKAIVPLLLLLCLFAVAWALLVDRVVQRTIEEVGAEILGARVDVASADLSLTAGRISILGLEAANPDSPMRNLVEAEEIVADVRMPALFRKKVVIEQVSVRGVRFGTERSESGALENPSPTSGQLARQVSGWADQVRVPPLNLEGLGTVVATDAIALDSLRTLAEARSTLSLADSSRRIWEEDLRSLNAASVIDSARALVSSLNSANPISLGVTGITRLAGSARNTLTSVRNLENRVTALDSSVRAGRLQLEQQVRGVVAAREADYRYALRLLRLPSLDAPDVSPAIFSEMSAARLRPVLYWVNQAARYLPPGLDPRRVKGPERTRRPGTTVVFPGRQVDPDFLIELADVDMLIGGAGAAAGSYAARLTGLTSQPAVYGQPMRVSVERTGGIVGPTDISVSALLDRTGARIRDSLAAHLRGVDLPVIDLGMLGARLNMGGGTSELVLARSADSIAGTWVWKSSDVAWSRLGGEGSRERGAGSGGQIGDVVLGLLWRTVSALNEVEIEVRFAGPVTGPSLHVSSNVGGAVARSLRAELGREIARAEQQVRAQVDRLVDEQVNEARARVDAVRSEIEERIGVQLSQLTAVRQELEQALRRRVPAGQWEPTRADEGR